MEMMIEQILDLLKKGGILELRNDERDYEVICCYNGE